MIFIVSNLVFNFSMLQVDDRVCVSGCLLEPEPSLVEVEQASYLRIFNFHLFPVMSNVRCGKQ